MKDVASENLRNVAIVGHGQTGKTSLVSAMLFNTGMVNRLCSVDQGNTVTDYDEEEIEKLLKGPSDGGKHIYTIAWPS